MPSRRFDPSAFLNVRKRLFPSRPAGVLLGLVACGLAACSSGGDTGGQGAIVRAGETPTAAVSGAATPAPIRNISDSGAAVIIADEPRAVIIARDVLEDGGTVADAATALYFTLAVTMPSAASLGGGGVCLHHDAEEEKVESIDFLARTPAVDGPIAVPGNVRGFALIHARHGKLLWNEVIAPAERIAVKGIPVSRAFSRRLHSGDGLLASAPFVNERLRGPTGALLKEGDRLVQADLAVTMGRIRGRGAGAFYTGHLAQVLVQEIAAAGGTVTIDDLRSYRPTVADPARREMRNRTALIPAVHTGAGALQQDVLARLPETPQSSAEVEQSLRSVLAERGAPSLPGDFGSTSFVVAGRNGDAIACALTMNGAFGAGVGGRELGIVYARAPQRSAFGLAGAFLAPVMVRNDNNGSVYFVGAGAGGPSAAAGALYTALATGFDREPNLGAAVANTRSDLVNPVHAVACPAGLTRRGEDCQFAVDPRGAGLAAESLAVN